MNADTSTVPHRRADIFVSIVAVMDGTVSGARDFLQRSHAEIAARYANYEFILVDNGLAAEELIGVRDGLAELPCIRVVRLSRPSSADTAFFAGLEAAIGDFVITMSPMHDPVLAVPEMIALLRNGNDVVQGESTEPIGGSALHVFSRRLFYWYNRKYLGVSIPSRATYFMGLTRRAVNSLTASTRSHRYLRHLVRDIGFKIERYFYTPIVGPDRRRTIKSGYNEAVEMVTSYSTHPLRVVTVVGVVAAFVNLLYAIYAVVYRLVSSEVAEGWASTSVQLSVMFFIICLILAALSEYVGRILTETRREPSYFVMEELESETLIADLERRNVSD